jgi:phage-related protein
MGSDRPLVWLHGDIKTPPLSQAARLEVGFLLRRLQRGDLLGMPHSRRMQTIGNNCHELRINDEQVTWRIIHQIDPDAIVIVAVFPKKTSQTPKDVIRACRMRLKRYDDETS